MQSVLDSTKTHIPSTPSRRIKRLSWRHMLRQLAPLMTLLLVLGAWHLVTALELYPQFIIPTPASVAETFVSVLQDGSLWEHTQATLGEMLIGLALGAGLGVMLGYWIGKYRLLEDLFAPMIVAFQSTPVVAYAPLLIIWFGNGVTSKIVTCAIIVFFPMLMNTMVGIRQVPRNLRDLMRTLHANPYQTFLKLELPAALPILLTGLKTSATLSVIGAVVGEFVSARSGLGFLVMLARNQYDTPLVFVAVFTMTALALGLYMLVTVLEWRLLAWQRRTSR